MLFFLPRWRNPASEWWGIRRGAGGKSRPGRVGARQAATPRGGSVFAHSANFGGPDASGLTFGSRCTQESRCYLGIFFVYYLSLRIYLEYLIILKRMSVAMISDHSPLPAVTPQPWGFAQPSHDKGQDILKVLWNWKWLLTLAALLGGNGGFFYFSQQAPTYQSTALVQIVYPSGEAAGFDSLDASDGRNGQSRLDESRVIQSARVIDLAIEAGQLTDHELFAGMRPVEIRDWILDSRRLTVEPAGRDNSTALIEIRFVCTDQELSQQVVQAVIDGYDSYLEAAYKNLGAEVVAIVGQAHDKLRTSYEDLSARHATFRRGAPMIWLGDEARNQYAENSIKVNSSINELQIQIRKLEATLQHIDGAQAAGRPVEAILLMLASDAGLSPATTEDPATNRLTAIKASEALPFSSVERRAMLMELQMREQELLDTVGEGHPSVASIQRRIGLLDQQIVNLAETERRLEAERAQDLEPLAKWNPREKLTLWRGSLEERLASLEAQQAMLEDLAKDNDVKSKELEDYLTTNRLLNSELNAVQTLLDGYTSTLSRINVLPQGNRRTLETLTPAMEGSFFGPSLPPYLLGGAVLGFLSLAGLAVLLDSADKSFRSPEEITQSLGMSILGHVPQMALKVQKPASAFDASLCTVTGSCQNASESFRSLRTGLYFSESGGESRVIQVTSPGPGDGKSTVSANLAISIAQSGRSVLLIDADMRRPRIAKLMGCPGSAGLGDVLIGRVGLDRAIQTSSIANLSILAGRNEAPNPAELLSHDRFHTLLEKMRQSYDYVIVDTPPVLAVADASAVAARVDGVLLTLRLRRDARPTALQAAHLLEGIGARMLGVVVNGVTGRGYNYHYGNYGYGDSYGRPSSDNVLEESSLDNPPDAPQQLTLTR